MTRRKGRQVSYQIRVSQSVKDKLNELRTCGFVKLSYNGIINEILSNQEQLEKYKIVSKLISKIDQGHLAFQWEYDRLKTYIEEHESKRI